MQANLMHIAASGNAVWSILESLSRLRQTLASRLAYYRDKRGWTQHDLAAAVGKSASGIRGYEQMTRWPDPEDLEHIARALGIRPVDLLTAPEDKPATSPEEALAILAAAIRAPVPAALTDHQQELLRLVSGIHEEDLPLVLESFAEVLDAAGLLPASESASQRKSKKASG